tara:strand:- start:23013 stop:23144 length:132 start_codon:yes stop_codon:yes gene_type:complete
MKDLISRSKKGHQWNGDWHKKGSNELIGEESYTGSAVKGGTGV